MLTQENKREGKRGRSCARQDETICGYSQKDQSPSEKGHFFGNEIGIVDKPGRTESRRQARPCRPSPSIHK